MAFKDFVYLLKRESMSEGERQREREKLAPR